MIKNLKSPLVPSLVLVLACMFSNVLALGLAFLVELLYLPYIKVALGLVKEKDEKVSIDGYMYFLQLGVFGLLALSILVEALKG